MSLLNNSSSSENHPINLIPSTSQGSDKVEPSQVLELDLGMKFNSHLAMTLVKSFHLSDSASSSANWEYQYLPSKHFSLGLNIVWKIHSAVYLRKCW